MRVYVICDNDALLYAVINDIEKAELKRKYFADLQYKRSHSHDDGHYFHIHEIEGEE